MPQLEQGLVVRVKPGFAEVEIVSSSKCKQCSACGISGSGKTIIGADNAINAQIGDHVEVQISSAAKDIFPLLFLGVPILFFFIAIIIGNRFSELMGILFGFFLMALGFIVSAVMGRLNYFNKIFGSKIIRRVT